MVKMTVHKIVVLGRAPVLSASNSHSHCHLVGLALMTVCSADQCGPEAMKEEISRIVVNYDTMIFE